MQDCVPGGVSEAVVHGLEAIEVAVENCPACRAPELTVKGGAVGQSRQRVVGGGEVELVLLIDPPQDDAEKVSDQLRPL